MTDPQHNEIWPRILDAAADLFARRGYKAVRLRDIAEAVGMRHASLYYYVPGGKEQLYVAVIERTMERHRRGLEAAIDSAGDNFRRQVHAISTWLSNQPPVDIVRMHQSDMPEIDSATADRLMALAYNSLRLPVVAALDRAQKAGVIRTSDISLAAMALISLIQSVHAIPEQYRIEPSEVTARLLADMLLDGWMV